MKIKWLGHSAFIITSENGVKVLTDPYESGSYGGAIKYGPIEESVDIVTISHSQHEDHNYVKGLKGEYQVIRCVGSKKTKDIEFKGTLAYHDKTKGMDRGSNTVMSFKVDGITVCHLGDLGHILDDLQLAEIGNIDILLIPIGGVFTIDASEATELVNKMKPKIVIPMHYKTEKCDFPLLSVEEFLKGKEGIKRIKGSEIEIKDLPSSREIIVLEHAL